MKKINLIIITLITILLSCKHTKQYKNKEVFIAKTQETVKAHLTSSNIIADISKNIFLKDSGYILKKEGYKLLKQLMPVKNDSIAKYYENLKKNDTIGKFFKKESVKYICIRNIYCKDTPLKDFFICEIDSNNAILKKEKFGGAYGLDDFIKKNDYFIFKTYGRGSAYSACRMYVFKELVNNNSILIDVFNGLYSKCEKNNRFGECFCNLTSNIKFKPTSLIIDYKFEIGNVELDKYRVKKTEIFQIEYTNRNNKWIASDSIKLNKLKQIES